MESALLCQSCGEPAGAGGMFCEGCRDAWEDSPERQEVNDKGIYGEPRVAFRKAMGERLRREGKLPWGTS